MFLSSSISSGLQAHVSVRHNYKNYKMFLSNDWKAEMSQNDTGFQIVVSGFARTGMHTILPEIFKVYPPGFDQQILQLGISNVVDNPHGILHEVHYSEQVADCEEYQAVNIYLKNELLVQIGIIGKEQCI